MSKFFQSKTYTEIDDANYSYNTTWSSNRITVEIENLKPKLKIGELQDVNTISVNDDYVLSYSTASQTWVAKSLSSVATGDSGAPVDWSQIKQINRLGVLGTATAPEIISIPYTTIDFKIPKINMLKFKTNELNLTLVEGEFNSSDLIDYKTNEFVTFDGVAKLKTSYAEQMEGDINLPSGKSWVKDFDKSPFKEIVNINVDNSIYPILTYEAIPHDQILIQEKDYNLNNVSKVLSFELNGQGKNIRVLCSIDEGVSWNYFDGIEFQPISQLTLDKMRTYGNTITEFNLIKERWNYICRGKKIRFAYLLSMDNISDIEYIDSITLHYNGTGVWIQAKDTEYDVEISNTEIKIYCYISGDIKINYEEIIL